MTRLSPETYLPESASNIRETDKNILYDYVCRWSDKTKPRVAKKYQYIGGPLDGEFYPSEASQGKYVQCNLDSGGCLFLFKSLIKGR